jgi:1-phosphofructokinase
MSECVVTVTLNPAIDRTVWVDELVAGTTHRTADTQVAFGGKGINVARTVSRIGAPVVAIGLVGEDQAVPMAHHLESAGVQPRFIPVPGETRTNLKVIEQANERLTEINGIGPEVSAGLIDAVEAELLGVVAETESKTVVLAGSVPHGAHASVYARWITFLRQAAPYVRVLVDASDEALDLAVQAAPFFVKPNRSEAEALTGRLITTAGDASDTARQIARRGPNAVLLSLGSHGAVASCGDDAEVIEPHALEGPSRQLQSTVGAGDAMVARVAVELARLSGETVEPEEFFAMSRLAVLEAEGQIVASAALPPTDAMVDPSAIAPQPASATEIGVTGSMPMVDG